MMADKDEECFKGLWCERYGLILAKQKLPVRVNSKRPEFVHDLWFRAHTRKACPLANARTETQVELSGIYHAGFSLSNGDTCLSPFFGH